MATVFCPPRSRQFGGAPVGSVVAGGVLFGTILRGGRTEVVRGLDAGSSLADEQVGLGVDGRV